MLVCFKAKNVLSKRQDNKINIPFESYRNISKSFFFIPFSYFPLFIINKLMYGILNCVSFMQDDEDGHLVVLIIIEELMSKTQEEFLDNFARLGVFSKVQALMGNAGEADAEVIKSTDSVAKGYK